MVSKQQQSRIAKSNVSRSKAGERRVAKLLTDWSHVPFQRRKIEGRDPSTITLSSTSDVVPITRNFLFTVEVKIERGFSLDAMMSSPQTSLFSHWWHQVSYDAKLVNDLKKLSREIYPLLFFKPHPGIDWVAFGFSTLPLLWPKQTVVLNDKQLSKEVLFNHIKYDAFTKIGPVTHNVSRTKNKRLVALPLDGVIICRWKDFAANVDPQNLFY